MSEAEHLLHARQRYVRYMIVLAFAFALLHAIHPFFFTLLFWSSLGMGIMALYYHIHYKVSQRGQRTEYTQANRRQGHRAEHKQAQPTAGAPNPPSKKVVLMIVLFAFVGFFVFMIIIFVSAFSEEDEYTMALSVEPEAIMKARRHYEDEQYQEAIRTLQPLMTEEVNDIIPILILGDSYYALQRYDSAYVYYDDAYLLGERSPFLCHALAYMLDEKGDTENAIKLYKESVSMDSARVEIYQRLSELEPQNSSAYLHLKQRFSAAQ
jgi:tetratricopeptide (TPR) repeat protein